MYFSSCSLLCCCMINYPLQITSTRGKMQNTLNITWFLLNVDNIIIIFYNITL